MIYIQTQCNSSGQGCEIQRVVQLKFFKHLQVKSHRIKFYNMSRAFSSHLVVIVLLLTIPRYTHETSIPQAPAPGPMLS